MKMDKLLAKNAAKAGASISAMEAGPSGRKATSASASGRGRTGGRSAAIAKEQCERIAEVDDDEDIVDVLEDASIAVATSNVKRTTRRTAATTKKTTDKQDKAKAPAARKTTRRKAAPIVEDSEESENEENSARLANGTVQAEAALSSDSSDASLAPPAPKRKPAATAAKRPKIILPKVDQPTADLCSSPDLAGTSYASGRSARSRRLH